MTHVHVKSEELTTNTDKTILEQVLSKLNKLELAIQLMLNQAEKNCNDKEETEQKEKEEKQEKKSSKSKNKKKDEEIDDIDDII